MPDIILSQDFMWKAIIILGSIWVGTFIVERIVKYRVKKRLKEFDKSQ